MFICEASLFSIDTAILPCKDGGASFSTDVYGFDDVTEMGFTMGHDQDTFVTSSTLKILPHKRIVKATCCTYVQKFIIFNLKSTPSIYFT